MSIKVKNTPINGGLSGLDKGLNRVATHKIGKEYSILRTFTKASNPQSASQTTIRNSFALTSGKWSQLTDAQRLAWNVASENTEFSSGKAMAIALNTVLAQAGLPMLDAPVGGFVAKEAVITLGATKLAFMSKINDIPAVLTSKLICKTSAIESAGTTKPRSMRFLSALVATSSNVATAKDFLPAFTSKYGVIGVGQKVFVELFYITVSGFTQKLGTYVFVG
jgi:hypothetical protein